ncbi:MAG: C-GCAxxG-C-C family protein [Endomicrobiaceae bacterium]|nr:C-GCAxxG-C-C family protein [Endomicrobiaceae bacterium]
MKKSDIAKDLFQKGYNCSQSVLCAFCDDIGIDFDTALKISSSFGGGMGRLREVCGAVTAMFMVTGIKYGYIDPKDQKAKAKHYKLIQLLAKKFSDKYGSIVCRDLLGLDNQKSDHIPSERTKEYYQKRPCIELVCYAADVLEELILTEKESKKEE